MQIVDHRPPDESRNGVQQDIEWAWPRSLTGRSEHKRAGSQFSDHFAPISARSIVLSSLYIPTADTTNQCRAYRRIVGSLLVPLIEYSAGQNLRPRLVTAHRSDGYHALSKDNPPTSRARHRIVSESEGDL